MAEYSIKAVPEQNRLFLTLAGKPQAHELAPFLLKFKEEISRLQPGCTVLAMMKDFKPVGRDIQMIVRQIMLMTAEANASKSARVVNPLFAMQLDRISREFGYETRNFDNKDEAEAYLDGK